MSPADWPENFFFVVLDRNAEAHMNMFHIIVIIYHVNVERDYQGQSENYKAFPVI